MAGDTYVPSTIGGGDFTDFTVPASGATDTGKVWVWNNATGKFGPTATLTNFTLVTPTIASFVNANHDHSSSAGGGTLTITGYLPTTGAAAGGTSSRQQFTNGLKVGTLQPISDGVTAFQAQATGGTVALNIDTTNNRVGFGGNIAPAQAVDVTGSIRYSAALIGPAIQPASDSTTALRFFKADGITAVLTVDTTNGLVQINAGVSTISSPIGFNPIGSTGYVFFQPVSNRMALGRFGAEIMRWDATQLSINAGSYTAGVTFGSAAGNADVGISRNAAGVMEINSATAGTLRDIKVRNIINDKIYTTAAVTNTNTPSGATAKALPIYDAAGTLLGYVPVYASQW